MFPSPRPHEHSNYDNDEQDLEESPRHAEESLPSYRRPPRGPGQGHQQRGTSIQEDEKLTDSASESLADAGNISNHDGRNSSPAPLRTSPTSIYAQSIGLHQRQRHFRTAPTDGDDSSYNREEPYYSYNSDFNSSAHNTASRRSFVDGSPDNKYGKQRYQHAALKHNKRRHICGARTQSILLALGLSYLALAIYMYKRVTTNDDYLFQDPIDSERLLELVNQMEKQRVARSFLDERESTSKRSARNLSSRRISTRYNKTRPVAGITYEIEDRHLNASNYHKRQIFAETDRRSPESEAAPLESLCGFHAQNASLFVPQHYLIRDALGSHSRVLITGITDMLGVRLAVFLRKRCHATVVVAIDPTFPNTISGRLRLLDPLQVLAKHVPKLNILGGYMGVDPLKREKHDILMNVTGELDIVRTFRPTHIVHLANFFQTTEFNNVQHPYVKIDGDQYRPSLYHIRSSLAAMEQLLMSIALMDDEQRRPQLLYTSSSSETVHNDKDTIIMSQTHLMQEIMADAYDALLNVHSTAMRLPTAVFGPWHNDQSPMHQILATSTDMAANVSSLGWSSQDFLYVDDAAEAFVAAMQFRAPQSITFALESAGRASWQSVLHQMRALVASAEGADPSALMSRSAASGFDIQNTRRYLSWFPRTTVKDGLIRTMAWYLDRNTFAAPAPFANHSIMPLSGDGLLARHSLSLCPADEPSCRVGSGSLPCASECILNKECTPSVFDSMISVMNDVTDGCQIVLYTQLLANDASNLKLHTEYMDEGFPLICTVAFVAFESPLVQTVVQKVPDHEQVRLGVVPRAEDFGSQEAIHNLKRAKLNGRLLYQGWILVWPDDAVPDPLPHPLKFLLKLSPGRFFSKSVKHAVFIEESFGVSPKHDDIKFLVQQLHRDALPKRTVKKKTPPKTKIRLPAEPARRAVILMSELRQQEAAGSVGTKKDKISIKQASRYMRFECGERSLGKEHTIIKAQREFYERMVSFVNRNTMRSPLEPQYTFALKHWARTRWVVHDLELAEGRQLRCDWYREHLRWEGSNLDQLSFAYVMAKQELDRRLKTEVELADRALKVLADWTEIKRLLTDVLEWHALTTDRNKDYTPYGELTALPYDHVDSEEGIVEGSELVVGEPLLFVRIMSDRVMTMARGEWTPRKQRSM